MNLPLQFTGQMWISPGGQNFTISKSHNASGGIYSQLTKIDRIGD